MSNLLRLAFNESTHLVPPTPTHVQLRQITFNDDEAAIDWINQNAGKGAWVQLTHAIVACDASQQQPSWVTPNNRPTALSGMIDAAEGVTHDEELWRIRYDGTALRAWILTESNTNGTPALRFERSFISTAKHKTRLNTREYWTQQEQTSFKLGELAQNPTPWTPFFASFSSWSDS